MDTSQTIGIIGGTGLYQLDGLEQVEKIRAETPFGPPSSPVTSGYLGGVRLLFLARHGTSHHLLPTEVNSRANIYALKALGAQWVLSVSAVGSLQEELRPGELVVPDQIIDRTRLRANTFFGDGLVAHVSFADPFCPELRRGLEDAAAESAKARSFTTHRGGTYVCMEGPAFSTRAESNLYRSWGGSLIGMTALPEAKLAREAELSYAILALVTDYDCWRSETADVDVHEIMKTMAANLASAKDVIARLVPRLKNMKPSSVASSALATAFLTPRESWPAEAVERLRPLLARYL